MPEVLSARDNPETLREYECVLILRPDTLQEGILTLNNKIKELIEKDEGRMLLVENWGKRRLAYEIRKQLKGIYMYYMFLGHSPLIRELERNFRMLESIIRYFTVRVDENIDPTARPGELSEEAFLAASATRPDEEELATGYVMTGTGEKIPVSKLGYRSKAEQDAFDDELDDPLATVDEDSDETDLDAEFSEDEPPEELVEGKDEPAEKPADSGEKEEA
ncbi:MAG: 30S ribosomal protein S6 [bacterium]